MAKKKAVYGNWGQYMALLNPPGQFQTKVDFLPRKKKYFMAKSCGQQKYQNRQK